MALAALALMVCGAIECPPEAVTLRLVGQKSLFGRNAVATNALPQISHMTILA